MEEKKKEFENFKPAQHNSNNKDGYNSTSSYVQESPEKDAIINELQQRNENLMAEVNRAKISKVKIQSYSRTA